MPEVAGKKFTYTKKGMDQAKQYRKRLKKKTGYGTKRKKVKKVKKVMKPKY